MAGKRPLIGILAILLSVFFFTAQGLLLRGGRIAFGPATAIFWRSLVGLVLVSIAAIVFGLPLLGRRFGLLFQRGFAGSLALLLFFTAVDRIDLGTATALCYTYPIFGTFLSSIILKERLTRGGWLAMIVAWIGIAIAIGFRPAIGAGEFAGLGAGILSGVAVHSIRALRRAGESVTAILFHFFLYGILISLPGGFAESSRFGLDSGALPILITVGVAATFGQTLITLAYKHVSTRAGASLSLLVVPASIFGAWTLFGERPVAGAVWGALLFGGAIVFLVTREDGVPREVTGG
jgi:drug/metabolite transporter (DMT)-like permease